MTTGYPVYDPNEKPYLTVCDGMPDSPNTFSIVLHDCQDGRVNLDKKCILALIGALTKYKEYDEREY